MFHKSKALYDMWNKTTPETKDLLAKTFRRAMKVAENADAAAAAAAADKAADKAADDAARRAEYATADAVINRDKQNGSNQPIDINDDDYYKLWKHTPLPNKGGSRKRSINCRRPRGFSQRQHCKYGRRGRAAATRRRIKSKSAR